MRRAIGGSGEVDLVTPCIIRRASHSIFSAYGFWLPNDPRGSWSDWVRSWDVLRHGRATKVDTRSSLAARPHDRHRRLEAKQALQFPAVRFNGRQALAVGRGFRRAIEESGYTVFACTILPEHVHVVLGRHQREHRRIIAHLKARATQQLLAEGLHPLAEYSDWRGQTPSPWGRNSWSVFLSSAEAIHAAIRYVERNPLKEGKPIQHWSFVVPFQPEQGD